MITAAALYQQEPLPTVQQQCNLVDLAAKMKDLKRNCTDAAHAKSFKRLIEAKECIWLLRPVVVSAHIPQPIRPLCAISVL